MIDYEKTKRGDILRLVGAGAPGHASLGDLLRVTEVHENSVLVEDRNGDPIEFVFNCGAARLELTEWTDDFPKENGQCEHGKGLTDYCEPCGRINGG